MEAGRQQEQLPAAWRAVSGCGSLSFEDLRICQDRSMGLSTSGEPTFQVWTSLLKKQRLKYDNRGLIPLLTWCKSHKLDVTEGASLDFRMWDWVGRLIFQAKSVGGETVISIIKPWGLIVDLLRQI